MFQISPLVFFSPEKELLSWTDLRKKTPWRTKILISPVWNKILEIWDTLELFRLELLQNWKKYVYYIFTEKICSACNPMQVAVFLQKCDNFVEQRLKLSHFEGSIIVCLFIILIVWWKFDKRNNYWRRYGLLKTNFKVSVTYIN